MFQSMLPSMLPSMRLPRHHSKPPEGNLGRTAAGRAGSWCRFVGSVVLVSVALASVVRASDLSAQSKDDLLDVGSFTLLVDGQRVGREQFSLRRTVTPDGATLELRAESATGDRRSAVRLEADSAGTPLRYSVEERVGATTSLRLGGQRVRGRFTTLSRSVTGESAREYLLSPGAIILEDQGTIQYALVVRRSGLVPGDSLVLPVLTPVENRHGSVRVTLDAVTDSVSIAGSRRLAWRYRIVAYDGEERVVWADPEGRLLRVRIPSRNLEALRDDVPRSGAR